MLPELDPSQAPHQHCLVQQVCLLMPLGEPRDLGTGNFKPFLETQGLGVKAEHAAGMK